MSTVGRTTVTVPPTRPGVLSWSRARETARRAGLRPLPVVGLPLAGALGHVLAEPLGALTDLPAFDTSAMDGWAVAGPGPWRVAGRVLAGRTEVAPLADGSAVEIATGARQDRGHAAARARPGESDNRSGRAPARPGVPPG